MIQKAIAEELGANTFKQFDVEDPISQSWNSRCRDYMDKIEKGSLFDVAEVFRELFKLRISKNLSFDERKILNTARNLLIKILCTAKKIDIADLDEKEKIIQIESLFEILISDSISFPFVENRIDSIYQEINQLILDGLSPQEPKIQKLFTALRSFQDISAIHIASVLEGQLDEPINAGREAIRATSELIEKFSASKHSGMASAK